MESIKKRERVLACAPLAHCTVHDNAFLPCEIRCESINTNAPTTRRRRQKTCNFSAAVLSAMPRRHVAMAPLLGWSWCPCSSEMRWIALVLIAVSLRVQCAIFRAECKRNDDKAARLRWKCLVWDFPRYMTFHCTLCPVYRFGNVGFSRDQRAAVVIEWNLTMGVVKICLMGVKIHWYGAFRVWGWVRLRRRRIRMPWATWGIWVSRSWRWRMRDSSAKFQCWGWTCPGCRRKATGSPPFTGLFRALCTLLFPWRTIARSVLEVCEYP